MNCINDENHKAFVLWAANCAEHVLCNFEENSPHDNRPREAITAARTWVDGKISLFQVRKFAFAAHAAARDTTNPEAIAAARSAGHAAATVHVYTHAKYAAQYATKSAKDVLAESIWQTQNLQENLTPIDLNINSKKSEDDLPVILIKQTETNSKFWDYILNKKSI